MSITKLFYSDLFSATHLLKMASATTGVEASAISVLKRAVELDAKSRYTESLICYQEGLQLLMEALKGID